MKGHNEVRESDTGTERSRRRKQIVVALPKRQNRLTETEIPIRRLFFAAVFTPPIRGRL